MKKLLFQSAMICVDLVTALVALYGAFWVRFEGNIPTSFNDSIFRHGWILAIIAVLTLLGFGIYNSMWRYASINELGLIILAVSAYSILFFIYFRIIPVPIPRSIYILNWGLMLGLVGTSRLSIRTYAAWFRRKSVYLQAPHLLIIGGGQAASMVIKELLNHPTLGKPLAILDDDKSKHGMRIHGVRVFGGMDRLDSVVETLTIDEILVAIPSAPESTVREVLNKCKETGCRLKRLPGIYSLIGGKVSVSQIRDVNIADLLGRPEVQLAEELISDYLTGQVVLVTGAGGSIGSELCRQIALFQPQLLVMLDIYENTLYAVDMELQRANPKLAKKTLVGSIRDSERLENIFAAYKPEVVFHAAAHKHVPLMEGSPEEAVKNNIFGTINVAEAAHRHRVNRFILVSTDKAVHPTSVMGATKRMAEIAIQNIDTKSKTEYAAVRFGNVLGSHGSAIPLFQQQIARGGPVTITHPEVTRYFMTVSEAVQLVIQAGAMARGGEIFVLDMGEPVKIVDLARDLIRLSGFRPDMDIKLEFTGLRPGEKMYEELNLSDEHTAQTCHEKIFVYKPIDCPPKLQKEMQHLLGIVTRSTSYEPEFLLKFVFGSDEMTD